MTLWKISRVLPIYQLYNIVKCRLTGMKNFLSFGVAGTKRTVQLEVIHVVKESTAD